MYIPLRKAWKVNYTRLAGDADGKAATVRDAVQQVKVEQAAALKAVRAAMAAAKGEPAAAALDALIAEKEAAAAWLAPAANASRGVVPGWPTLDAVAVSALPGHHLGLSHVALDAQVYGVAAALDAKTKGSNPPGAYDQWPKAVAVPPPRSTSTIGLTTKRGRPCFRGPWPPIWRPACTRLARPTRPSPPSRPSSSPT